MHVITWPIMVTYSISQSLLRLCHFRAGGSYLTLRMQSQFWVSSCETWAGICIMESEQVEILHKILHIAVNRQHPKFWEYLINASVVHYFHISGMSKQWQIRLCQISADNYCIRDCLCPTRMDSDWGNKIKI